MNRISYTLVNEILKDNTTLIYGGGFKPPTKGHLAVVKQSLEKYPQVNKYIIFVGSGIRDGITQDQAVQIWNIYKKYLPVNMEVIPVSSPIKAVFDYSKENPDEDIIWVIGGRQGNEDDLKDFMNRTKTVKKYPNITAVNIITPISNISGTKARQALKSGDKSEIITYFPSDISNQDIEQIIDITTPDLINEDEGFDRVDYYTSFITNVVPSNFNVFREENKIIVDNILNNTQENVAPNHKGKSSPYGSGYKKLNENTQKIGYRAGEFNPDYPAETLKDKGIGLTFSKIGLLGTGHYFLGSKQKAKELKNKGKYNVISQIDLSSYKLFKPDDPVGFYENVKELTAYIHSLDEEDLKEPETKEIIEDAVDGFSEYLNIPYNKVSQIINQYVSDIINKKLDGPLLLNRLLFDYDGIDMTNTSLDDFSVGSLIFDKKLKPNTYKVINDKKSLKENINSPVNILKKITELISFMKEKGYNIEPLPKLKIVSDDKNNANKFLGKTAHYDPSNKCITLYTYGRHPKDIVRSFSHEMVHHIQNLEGRLGNISTTNTTEDDHLNKIEAEANLKGTMTFRNWTDSLNEKKNKDPFGINQYARELAQGLEENNKIIPSTSEYKKIKEYTDKYKKYVLNELFEKDLPIIDKVSKNLYIVSNGNDIEAKYDIRLEIPERDLWSINWFFTPNNKNKSQEAWKQVTATSFRVLEDWLKTNNPKALYISGNTEAKTKLYKAYVDKLQTLLNNRYKIDNSDEDRVVLRSIEEIKKSSIKKRIETLNESYDQALNYFQNGDINSKSKIERWSSIKHKIERKVIKEIYKITEEQSQNYIIYCDMDGVIADFDKRFIDLSGMSPNQYEEKYGTEQFWDFIDNEIGVRFWVGIPWMKDGKQLWEYIEKYKPTLLSAPSRNNESRLGKRLWVKKHIPGTKLILASRKNKQNYAQPNAILIDDRSDTIIEWENQGGIGILHTSAEETINKLNKLML